jgi:hypothetical protein
MPNSVDCLVVPESFSRIKTELLDHGDVFLELQYPSVPVTRDGISTTKVVLTKGAVEWLNDVFTKYRTKDSVKELVKMLETGEYDARPSELKQGSTFDVPFESFAKELDESADKLPPTAFSVNPEGV